LPLASSEYPAGDDPEAEDEDEEDIARTDRHQRLEDEASVEADPVQRSDTAGRGVREEFTM